MSDTRKTEYETVIENFFTKKINKRTGVCSWTVRKEERNANAWRKRRETETKKKIPVDPNDRMTFMACDENAIYSYETPIFMRMSPQLNIMSATEWFIENTTRYSVSSSQHMDKIHSSEYYDKNRVVKINLSKLICSYKKKESQTIPKIELLFHSPRNIEHISSYQNPLLFKYIKEVLNPFDTYISWGTAVSIGKPGLSILKYNEKVLAVYDESILVMPELLFNEIDFYKAYYPEEISNESLKLSDVKISGNIIFIPTDVTSISSQFLFPIEDKDILKKHSVSNPIDSDGQFIFESALPLPSGDLLVKGEIRKRCVEYPKRGTKVFHLEDWHIIRFTKEVARYE